MPGRYVPDAGDIVWMNFTPQSGHEQAGRRPAVVLSPKTCILMQRWTAAFDFSNVDVLIEAIKATNALEHSRAQFKLTMPDNSSLG